MAELMRVPEVAAGAEDVVVQEWLVAAGAEVAKGSPLVVVETDKAVVEVEADTAGVLLRPLVESGSRAEVGAPLALLGSAEEASGDIDALLAGVGVIDGPTPPAPETAGTPPKQAELAAPPTPTVEAAGSRRPVSPIARKLLREAGVSLEDVQGTGPGGRVTRRDVVAVLDRRKGEPTDASALPGPAPAVATSSVEGAGWVDIPHTRIRRAIAQRLGASKREVPHFYVRRAVRIDELLALRARLNAAGDVKVSVNDMVLKAVAVAHREVPEANVIWTEDALRQFDRVDIAFAVAAPNGLVTPVLRGVEALSLGQISRQVKSFVEQATAGRLQQRDLEGGSISVSNLGMYGVDEFAAIISPPHSAILAVGAGVPSPVVEVVDGETRLAVGTVMNVVLSVDHRAVDGALAARWLDALVMTLEAPFRLVL